MKNYLTIQELQSDLATGKTSCAALVDSYLKKIEENKYLNAFLEVFADEAKQRAIEIDKKIKEGQTRKLAGVVIGIKDNICYKGHRVSAASKILEGFESLYSSTVVERLLKEDAIIIGRLNCDEFAMGGSNENSAYGNVLNPIDNSRVPGGSSGGSATAVKAGMCHAAFGSDTGGSIRQPAAFCGIVGMKPTYGRVSRHGLIAYASSFDQIGPFTNSVEDAALLLEIIAGADEYDSTASGKNVDAYSSQLNFSGKAKIAYIKDCIEHDGIDKEVSQNIFSLIDALKKNGHAVEPTSFPYIDYMVPAYYVLTTAEASSNLARFSGVLYGHRSKEAKDVNETFSKSRSEGFGKEVQRRIMLGTFVLSAGYYDAYYGHAQKIRRVLTEKTNAILEKNDFILLPTTPKTAFRFGDNKDPVSMYLEDIFTVQANLTGLPAISLPIGKHSNGMPLGVQLIGKKFDEKNLLAFANYLMKEFSR